MPSYLVEIYVPGTRRRTRAQPCGALVPPHGSWRTALAASVLQASGFRRDVTVFRLGEVAAGESGSEPAIRRNTAAPVYRIEAAHNPEVVRSNPAPATAKGARKGAFRFYPHDHLSCLNRRAPVRP